MDAATPFHRWLGAAGLVALLSLGCQSTEPTPSTYYNPLPTQQTISDRVQGSEYQQGNLIDQQRTVADDRARNVVGIVANQSRPVTARPQAPADPPGPLAPLAPPMPVAPVVQGGPVSPAAVVGSPVGTPVEATPVGFTPGGAGALRAAVAPTGSPRVKVVAVVGAGNIVTDREVWETVRQSREWPKALQLNGSERDARERQLYKECLREIIDRELILDDMFQRLKKNGKPGVIDEVKEMGAKAADMRLRHFKREFKARTDEEFAAILAATDLTLPVVRRQIERQTMADEYVRSMLKEKGLKTGLAEVRTYYDRHPQEFQSPDRVKWLDIFISFNRFQTPRAAYDHAEAVRQQAAAGVDFAALSQQHDHGIAGRQNGEGTGSARGKILPVDVEPTVWALAPGQVSGLIETPSGYHIVKVAERDRAGLKPLDEKIQADVRDKLREQKVKAERAKLLDSLWRKGAVQVMDVPR